MLIATTTETPRLNSEPIVNNSTPILHMETIETIGKQSYCFETLIDWTVQELNERGNR